jgi:regulatory protein
LRALGRREHSAEQLRRKLESRGFDESIAAETVGDLAGRGWQSDARYAEMLIRSRISQGYGRMYIEGELRVAGVPDAEAAAALEAADCDWTQIAIDLHARKFGVAAETMVERNKQYRYLAGRGFTSGQIRSALKSAMPDED